MRIMTAGQLQAIGTRILDAAGSPHAESEWVIQTLVRSDLMGHDSHGLLRVPFYVERIESGELVPGAPYEVEREKPAMAVVNGHQGWGQVIAKRAMSMAIEKARQTSIAAVVVRNSQHAGRMGEWVSMAARENMIGLAFANSRGGVGPVAPWGGIDRRLKPNPMAFAAPTGLDWPVLVDITASVIAGGKVKLALLEGEPLPEGCLIDWEGRPTTDPAVFFAARPGAMLPLGGIAGHKGYALNILTDLMAGAVSASGVSGQNTGLSGNGLFFQVVNIADFLPVEEFTKTVQELMAWVKSSRRREGVNEILFPGEPEYRTEQRRRREGIPISEGVWDTIVETARRVGAAIPG